MCGTTLTSLTWIRGPHGRRPPPGRLAGICEREVSSEYPRVATCSHFAAAQHLAEQCRLRSNVDKARRKELLRQYRATEQEQARRTLGFGQDDLKSLLDSLDVVAGEAPCDHSPRYTRAWAAARGLDPDTVVTALQAFGGHCDCEVLANVTPDKFGWPD